jgi:TRAP transporter 4TM/12TM fusion protein
MNDSGIPRFGQSTDDLEVLRDNAYPKGQRRTGGLVGVIVTIASCVLSLITLYMAFRITFGPTPTRAGHLLFVIPLTFLLYPARKGRKASGHPTLPDYALSLFSAVAFGWAVYSAGRWELRQPYYDPVGTVDMVLGIVAVLTVFEATRRTVGIIIVWLNAIFITYALTGPIWPDIFEHRGISFEELIESLYLLNEGLFNFLMGIMATFLFTFLALGAFLRVSGGDRVFTDFALAAAGHRRGGPAKVAVISSALMGMLSGSTVSNVATTGAVTIPMMKRIGYEPHEAAAIETTASVGGALTPPLMGAGIFIMAAFTDIPLITLLEYSVLPAVLYFTSLYFYVDIKARQKNLKGLPRDVLPSAWGVVKSGGHIFIPVFVLIGLLLYGYTPFLVSSACVVMIFIVSFFKQATRLTPRKLLIALEASARVALTVSSLAASAAIIYGVLGVTGLMLKVTSVILTFSGGSSLIAIIIICAMSYILGMGLPVTAAYVFIAALGAPALIELGVTMLAAHMIIFWFSQDSTITPPICMTAFVAARIANAPPMKTGWQSVMMAKGLYLIPFIFAFGDLLSESFLDIFFDFAVLFCMFALLPIAVEGYYLRKRSVLQRIVLGLASSGFFMAALGPITDGLPWLFAAVVISSITFRWMRKEAGGSVLAV